MSTIALFAKSGENLLYLLKWVQYIEKNTTHPLSKRYLFRALVQRRVTCLSTILGHSFLIKPRLRHSFFRMDMMLCHTLSDTLFNYTTGWSIPRNSTTYFCQTKYRNECKDFSTNHYCVARGNPPTYQSKLPIVHDKNRQYNSESSGLWRLPATSHHAIINEMSIEFCKELIDAFPDLLRVPSHSRLPVHWACQEIYILGDNTESILHFACCGGNLDVVKNVFESHAPFVQYSIK